MRLTMTRATSGFRGCASQSASSSRPLPFVWREELVVQLGKGVARGQGLCGRGFEPRVAQFRFDLEGLGLAELSVVDANLCDVSGKARAAAGAWTTQTQDRDGRIGRDARAA